MASALARGWNEPAVVADIDRDRAEALAESIGGSVADSNAELAEQVDVVILCHKPAQLEEVAAEIRDHARAVVSILGGVPVANVEAAYPDTPVYRFMPNQAAEVQRGVSCYVAGSRAGDGPEEEILDLFGRIGTVVPLPEEQMETATAVMSCAPAWFALVAEALVDAGVEHGLDSEQAGRLVAAALAGTGALLPTRASVPPSCGAASPHPAGSPSAGRRDSRTRGSARRSTPPSMRW